MAVAMIGGPRLCEPLLATGLGAGCLATPIDIGDGDVPAAGRYLELQRR